MVKREELLALLVAQVVMVYGVLQVAVVKLKVLLPQLAVLVEPQRLQAVQLLQAVVVQLLSMAQVAAAVEFLQ
jgi:hypothetical protein